MDDVKETGQAGDLNSGVAEIVVTPEMIDSGVVELVAFDAEYDRARDAVKSIIAAVFGAESAVHLHFVKPAPNVVKP